MQCGCQVVRYVLLQQPALTSSHPLYIHIQQRRQVLLTNATGWLRHTHFGALLEPPPARLARASATRGAYLAVATSTARPTSPARAAASVASRPRDRRRRPASALPAGAAGGGLTDYSNYGTVALHCGCNICMYMYTYRRGADSPQANLHF